MIPFRDHRFRFVCLIVAGALVATVAVPRPRQPAVASRAARPTPSTHVARTAGPATAPLDDSTPPLSSALPDPSAVVARTDDPSPLENLLAEEGLADPAGTADLALRLPPGQPQERALAAAVRAWAHAQPRAAAEWIAALPQGRLRTLATEHLVPTWSVTSIDDATRWLVQQPAGAARDAGLRIVAHIVADQDPDLSFTLTESIGNDYQRNRMLETLGREWLQRDPVRATAALVQSSLPSAHQQSLIENVRKNLQ